jgi:DNA polymerase (family X)
MQSTLSNKEVGNIMKSLAALMELHEENPFKIKSYANAAFQLSRIPDVVMEMDRTTMEQTKGIGKSVAAKLVELRETGDIEALRKLLDMTPAGIIDMLQIKGLGAKKVRVIWKELGVEDVGELLYACYENRLAKLKGFGEKTQESVIQSIEYYQANLGKFHFATALQQAALMEADWKQSTAWSRTGALRRDFY